MASLRETLDGDCHCRAIFVYILGSYFVEHWADVASDSLGGNKVGVAHVLGHYDLLATGPVNHSARVR